MTLLKTLGAHATCVAALGSALAWSAPALAQATAGQGTAGQGASHKAAAEALFEEGRKLMAEGKVNDACPKFADSEQLDPSSSTLLNLASCYEKLGRTASAWATYREAASLASANGRAEHLAVAQKRADSLTSKLSRVTVMVATPVDGLEIKRDGAAVTRAEWGLAIPVDPGPHNYEATAPGKRAWGGSIQVTGEGGTTTLTVPPLQALPAAPAVAAVPATDPGAASASNAPVDSGTTTPPAAMPQESPPRTQRVIAGVVGGVGIVALGVGAGFALSAKSKYDASVASCQPTNKDLCSPDGVSKRDDARSAGNIATVSMLVGGGALVGAAILWFTAPSGSGQRTTTMGSLQVTPTLGGAMVRGQW